MIIMQQDYTVVHEMVQRTEVKSIAKERLIKARNKTNRRTKKMLGTSAKLRQISQSANLKPISPMKAVTSNKSFRSVLKSQ